MPGLTEQRKVVEILTSQDPLIRSILNDRSGKTFPKLLEKLQALRT